MDFCVIFAFGVVLYWSILLTINSAASVLSNENTLFFFCSLSLIVIPIFARFDV